MFKVSMEKLLKNSGGRYRLLQVAFLRTRQLNNGMPPLVKTSSKKTATIALLEIAEDKVKVKDAEPEQEDESESAE